MTPLKAIRVRCLNCVGFEKTVVRECDFTNCPLHALRMGRGARATLKVIRAYCMWCCNDQRAEVKQCPAKECPLSQYRSGRRPKMTRLIPGIASTAGSFGAERGRTQTHFSIRRGRDVKVTSRSSSFRDRAVHLTRPVSRLAFPELYPGRDRGRGDGDRRYRKTR